MGLPVRGQAINVRSLLLEPPLQSVEAKAGCRNEPGSKIAGKKKFLEKLD